MHIVTSTDILLPCAEDMGAWSVIACDQFTSEPEYWAAAEARAAEKPSALSLMLPEIIGVIDDIFGGITPLSSGLSCVTGHCA